jgi:hypothetical protein
VTILSFVLEANVLTCHYFHNVLEYEIGNDVELWQIMNYPRKLIFRVPLFLFSSIEFYGLKLKWLDLVAYRFHQLLQSAIAHSLPMFFSSVFFMLG